MGIWDQFLKSIYESSAGRIHIYSNMWAKVGSKWDKKRIKNQSIADRQAKRVAAGNDQDPRFTKEGELIRDNGYVLVSKPCVTNCPSPPSDGFMEGVSGYWVPMVECRKCQFYRKSAKPFNFPRCVFKAPESPKEVASSALNKTSDLMSQAMDKVKDILK